MIKKLLNCFLAVGILAAISNQSFAQTTNVSATWGTDGANAAGTVNSATVTGDITAAMVFGGTMRIFSTATQTTGNAVTDGGSVWQRIAIPNPAAANPSTAPTLPFTLTTDQQGAYDNTQFIEYTVTPPSGKHLQVTSITLPIIGFGSGDIRMVARYSVDGTAESNFNFFYKAAQYWVRTGDATSEVQDVALNPTQPLLPKRNSTSATDGGTATLDQVTLKFNGLQINVLPGQTFRVRFYPYMRGGAEPSSTGSRGIQTRASAVITGQTSDNALPSVLPLDFLSFTAKPDALNKFVNLNWSTTNEVNTKNFEIQKRTDASDFKTIGVVKSKNVSGVHHYAFVDGNLTNGNAYYRLNQTDNDGKSSFSDIVNVNIKSAISLSIYPNPVESSLSLSHPVTTNKAFAQIINLEGKIVLRQALSANTTTSQIDVSQLATGSYLVVFEDQLDKSTLKFIKK